MPQNRIIPYNPKLRNLARELRKNGTLSEVLFWNEIKKKSLGYEFHRQVPIDEFIVDFYCPELLLAIEIDGSTHDFNFNKDNLREIRLEELGVKIVRYSDIEVKKSMNEVLRSLENIISEIEDEMKKHPPYPPSKGEPDTITPPSKGEPDTITPPSKGEPDTITPPSKGEPDTITPPSKGEPYTITPLQRENTMQ